MRCNTGLIANGQYRIQNLSCNFRALCIEEVKRPIIQGEDVSLKQSLNKEPLKNLASKINYKYVAGILILIAGIILFFFSIHATKKIADANTLSQNISDFFQHNPTWNPIIKFFGGKAQEKIEYYNHMTLMVQIGSVVLTVLGAVMIAIFRKKKNQKQK